MTGGRLVPRQEQGALVFEHAGVELARYRWADEGPDGESPRPSVHPLRSLSGDVLTGWRPWDHRWHRGLSLALPHVGGVTFWGGPTYVRDQGYADLDNHGRTVSSGPAADGSEALSWLAPSREAVVRERRRLTARVLPDLAAWELALRSTWTNTSGGDLAFGSPATHGRAGVGYGGLLWRGARDLTGGRATGPRGPLQMGERAGWAAYCGEHDEVDRSSTLVLVDDSRNPVTPVPWFVRSEPFAALCPAPFFHEEWTLPAGASSTWRYRVLVADGARAGGDLDDLLALPPDDADGEPA